MGQSLPGLVAIVPARAVCYVSFGPQLALVGVVASGWLLVVLAQHALACMFRCKASFLFPRPTLALGVFAWLSWLVDRNRVHLVDCLCGDTGCTHPSRVGVNWP